MTLKLYHRYLDPRMTLQYAQYTTIACTGVDVLQREPACCLICFIDPTIVCS